MAALAWFFYVSNRGLMRLFFRLRVIGVGRLPKKEPFILAPNHASHLDAPALAAALSFSFLRRTQWLARSDVVSASAFLRLVCRLAQAIPIQPDDADPSGANLAAAAAVLRRGRNLVLFPEGQRSLTGELQPFHTGVGVLLQEFQVPVVPVLIRGTFRALPPHCRFPRPARVTVTFGPPLDPGRLEREGAGDLPAQRIAHALHRHLGELLLQHAGGRPDA